MTVAINEKPLFSGGAAYRLGLAAGAGTALFLVYLMAAVGVMAESGYRGDLAYAGVLMALLGGAAVSRLRAPALSDTMFATALAIVGVCVLAVVGGVHERAATSVAELIGLNAMFALGFAVSGLLLRWAAPAER
ncbi:hypothetical protein DJ010_04365 [Nocardioides silvaticus]|uniref:Uncharacterized protein n=1 Tax=Nocardioides silvaticus TaxID=2201891 RepID=A0A316TRK8_9ACTN|nr:hypothetical protein [Nocardioides silvaticus]PWN04844.1 hypothetical protein DJ010_04365 [Nocardioides silvaticus]